MTQYCLFRQIQEFRHDILHIMYFSIPSGAAICLETDHVSPLWRKAPPKGRPLIVRTNQAGNERSHET